MRGIIKKPDAPLWFRVIFYLGLLVAVASFFVHVYNQPTKEYQLNCTQDGKATFQSIWSEYIHRSERSPNQIAIQGQGLYSQKQGEICGITYRNKKSTKE